MPTGHVLRGFCECNVHADHFQSKEAGDDAGWFWSSRILESWSQEVSVPVINMLVGISNSLLLSNLTHRLVQNDKTSHSSPVLVALGPQHLASQKSLAQQTTPSNNPCVSWAVFWGLNLYYSYPTNGSPFTPWHVDRSVKHPTEPSTLHLKFGLQTYGRKEVRGEEWNPLVRSKMRTTHCAAALYGIFWLSKS